VVHVGDGETVLLESEYGGFRGVHFVVEILKF
jgi:hypothetical protein